MSRYFAGIGGNVVLLGQIEPCSSAEEVELARIAEIEDRSSSISVGAAKGHRSCASRLHKLSPISGNRCSRSSRPLGLSPPRQTLPLGRLNWSDCQANASTVFFVRPKHNFRAQHFYDKISGGNWN